MTHPRPRSAGKRVSTRLVLATLTFLAGCGAEPSGPGTLTAALVSPNGAEGSALVVLYGQGLGAVRAIEGSVFSREDGDTLRVVVVNPDGGSLRFTVAVDDITRTPTAAVLEVADPEDRLRTLAGYTVEITR